MRNEKFCAPDYDLFGGLDVDKRSLSVTFTNHQGFMGSLHTPNSAEYLVNHARKHFADQRVAFACEAGLTGYGLYDGIVSQGYRCLIVSPSFSRRSSRTPRHFSTRRTIQSSLPWASNRLEGSASRSGNKVHRCSNR